MISFDAGVPLLKYVSTPHFTFRETFHPFCGC